MRRHALIPLCMLFLAACGDSEDNPVAPDEDLVGSWAFDSTDIVDVITARIDEILGDLGVDQEETDELLADFRVGAGDSISGMRSTIRFNADGSFEDDQGGSGTWRVEGNSLIRVEDGDEERVKYFVDGDDLTLIHSFSWEWLLYALVEDQDFTDEEIELLEKALGLDEDTNIRVFYKRR